MTISTRRKRAEEQKIDGRQERPIDKPKSVECSLIYLCAKKELPMQRARNMPTLTLYAHAQRELTHDINTLLQIPHCECNNKV